MDNKQLFLIILAIIIAGLIISVGCFYGLSQNKNTTNITNNTTKNITNNTTKNITDNMTKNANTPEKASNANNEQNNQEKLEFNGRTHEQNVQEAKQSRDEGKQWAGATDEQIEEMISQEERDGGRF